MPEFDVRRLAAVDLHGLTGSRTRRWIVLTEFVLGVVLCGTFGVLALSAGGVVPVVIGVLLLGAAVNYVPLALHALRLSRAGALEAELKVADLHADLRYYTGAQALVLVPGAIAALAVRQALARPDGDG
jgi:hypothetical protein